MPVVCCDDCGRVVVREAEVVIAGQPPPRALLGVSVVVEYDTKRGGPGGVVVLCIRCGGNRQAAGQPAAAASPAPPAKTRAPRKPKVEQVETPRPALVSAPPAAPPSAADLAAARASLRPAAGRR